jgi:hypothetical protein
VVVSSDSCSEVKPMPRLRRPDTIAMRSWMERPSRSSEGTRSIHQHRSAGGCRGYLDRKQRNRVIALGLDWIGKCLAAGSVIRTDSQ